QEIGRTARLHDLPPVTTGSVASAARAAGTRIDAVEGLRLGTRAINVPITITTSPAQIQLTRGLRNALMIGCPVEGLTPSYTTYRSHSGTEWIETNVCGCWLA